MNRWGIRKNWEDDLYDELVADLRRMGGFRSYETFLLRLRDVAHGAGLKNYLLSLGYNTDHLASAWINAAKWPTGVSLKEVKAAIKMLDEALARLVVAAVDSRSKPKRLSDGAGGKSRIPYTGNTKVPGSRADGRGHK